MWTYFDARGKMFLRAKSYYSFGSSLHNVLQRFHDAGDTGVETKEQVLAAYEENWIDAGFSSPEEMADAFGEGREILERYVEEAAARDTGAKTLFVEKQLREDLGDFVLLGRVDRVDEYPDGRLEIVDYKSGRSGVSEDEVATDLAMSIYQLLLKRRFQDRQVSATIIALRSGESATATLDDEQLREVEMAVKELGVEILNANWEERPIVRKSLCEHCDFLRLCRQSPGFGT